MKTLSTRINKYPYFLWLTYFKELEFDFENMKVKSDVGESSITKVSKYWIFLLKYLPFVLLLTFGSYPKDQSDVFIFLGSFIIVVSSIYLLIKFPRYFIKYLIAFTIFVNLLIYNYSILTIIIDSAIVYIVELIILSILLRDIYKKNYNKYYFLESVKKFNTIHFAKKHNRPLVPLIPKIKTFGWKGKGLFRKKRGFDINFSFYLNGYFVRIEDEI